MADKYTLEVGGFTFAITPLTLPQISYNWKNNGDLIAKTERWSIRGWFENDPADLNTDWDALKTLLEGGSPLDVKFKLNGVEKQTLLTADHNNTPRFENLNVNETRGAFANNIQFTIDIVAERPIKFGKVVDFNQVEEEIIKAGQISEKRTRLSARGDGAEDLLKSLIPSDINLKDVRFVDRVQDNIFELSFTQITPQSTFPLNSKESKQGLLSWREKITVTGGFKPITFMGIMRDDPLRFKGKLRAATITIAGRIRSRKENLLLRELTFPPAIKRDDIDNISDTGPFIEEESDAGIPVVFAREYTITAKLQKRPKNFNGLRVRFKIADFGVKPIIRQLPPIPELRQLREKG